MEISTVPATAPVKPSAWPTRIRCPVEETGRNSVSPSTTPSKTASSRPHSFMDVLASEENIRSMARKHAGAQECLGATGEDPEGFEFEAGQRGPIGQG